jgi:NAD(P)H dehydrogenase (quinone)
VVGAVKVLMLVAHPCADSFTHACADAAQTGLTRGGHAVDRVDLYAERFRTALSREERLAYETDDPILDPQVADHAERLKQADALLVVYPTWWSGLPAILKGWFERVMVPGVGFHFDPATNNVKPGLSHLRRIMGISIYGSPRLHAYFVNDNGRRILTRALRMSCGWRTRPKWLAMYSMDTSTDAERSAFLTKIETTMAAL